MNTADCYKILYLDNAPYIGGAQINNYHALRMLDRQYFHPILVIPDHRKDLVPFFTRANVDIYFIPMKPLSGGRLRAIRSALKSVKCLGQVVRSHNVDLVFSSSTRTGLLAVLTKWLTGVKIVWRSCDISVTWADRIIALFTDRVTCVSRAVYERYDGWPRHNFQIIYSGVYAEDLTAEEITERKRALRQRLGMPPETYIVGSVANLQQWKGVHVLIQAFAEVIRVLPCVRLVHIGGCVPGYERYAQRVYQLAKDLGITEQIKFMGFQEDAYQYYPLFDIFIHVPTREGRIRRSEAFGHTPAEAMAYHLPVIASRCGGGVSEVVEEGVTGELVEPDDYKGLASRIVALIQQPEIRQRLGQAGYERYRERFTQAREVRQYESLFAELIDRVQRVH
jgi:glycosyltransferase involved in cell wall biosynthesis